MPNIAVLGIGNILLKDDGVGVEAANQLAAMPWPEKVSVIDAGTAILSLLDVFLKNDRIVVIDALTGGQPPGTIYRLTPEELGVWRTGQLSLHDVQVLDIVKMAALFDRHPEVIIYGIEPFEVELELGLSGPMTGRLPELVKLVKLEVETLLDSGPAAQNETAACVDQHGSPLTH